MRKTIIAGNWKMHKNSDEASVLVKEIVDEVAGVENVDVVVQDCENLDLVDRLERHGGHGKSPL